MAFQKGVIELKGSAGNMTFYTLNGKYIVRQKRSPDKTQFLSHKSKTRRKETATEFGISSKASVRIRRIFFQLLWGITDNALHGRLTATLAKILRSDPVNSKNYRIISSGDLQLLKGFQFNVNSHFDQILKTQVKIQIDRNTALINIEVPPLDPTVMLSMPPGASHFKIITSVGEIIIESGNAVTQYQESGFISTLSRSNDYINFSFQIKSDLKHTILVVLAVRFYQCINLEFVLLKNKYFMPTVIAAVSNPA